MSDFKKIYPGRKKLLFDGGANTKFERSIIEDNESPDCLNVDFTNGSVGTRDGFTKVNTASVGSFACDGIYTRQGQGNAETMVAWFGGNGYALAGTSLVTIPSAQSVMTLGFRVCAAQMENHIFFGNGSVTPYKYNGTDFTRHGVYPPSTMSVTNFTGAAGSLSGGYQYKITYVNSQSVEGNPSTASTTFTVTNQQISMTCLPIAPQSWGVASRRIYRTVTSGSTFMRVATINDNITTTYLDNTADTALGVTVPTNAGVPPVFTAICYHQRRLFMISTDNLIWYTDLDEPYTVGALNFIPIGDQSTDFPVGLSVYDNTLVVTCKKNIWLVHMATTSPTDWNVIKAKSSYSSKSPFGAFEYNNKLAFPAVQNDKLVGVAALLGDSVDPSSSLLTVASVGSELKSERIEPDMFDVQEAYLGNISSIVYKNKAYITLTKSTGTTVNNRVYVFDFSISNLSKNQKEAWAPWTGLNAAQFTIYGGSLYYGTSLSTGFIHKQSPGVYADDGVAINSYFWTKEFSGGAEEESFKKDFRYANLLIDLAGAYYMNVGVRADSDLGSGNNYQINLNPGGSLWGTMVWGRDMWGGGASQIDIRQYLAGARGKRIQFKFSNQNTVGQRFKVHWMNFTYNLKGPR